MHIPTNSLFFSGSIFPWRKNGFPSAVAMLQSMPDVVRFQYSEKDGDYRLFGIGSDDMFMPSWVVKAQGKNECLSAC